MGISYDSVEKLQRFAKKRKITYPLLSDAGSKTIEAYGLRNHEAKGTRIDGVPYPGTFIIDQQGVIRAKLFYDGYRKRHTGRDIIEAVKAIQ